MPEDSANLARLFNKLDRGDGIELTLIVVATIVLIRIAQRTLPWVANRLHGRPRHYLLASVPLLRLLLIGVALALMLPILIEPSMQNMVALLDAAGLASGFALKDYVSSLIAGVVTGGDAPNQRNGVGLFFLRSGVLGVDEDRALFGRIARNYASLFQISQMRVYGCGRF